MVDLSRLTDQTVFVRYDGQNQDETYVATIIRIENSQEIPPHLSQLPSYLGDFGRVERKGRHYFLRTYRNGKEEIIPITKSQVKEVQRGDGGLILLLEPESQLNPKEMEKTV